MLMPVKPVAELGQKIGGLPGGGPYVRPKPFIYGPVDERNAGQRRWCEQQGQVTAPDADVYLLENCFMCGGILITSDQCIVGETLINRGHEASFLGLTRHGPDVYEAVPSFFDREVINLKTGALLKQQWDGNYGHWLIEGLPRVAPLKEIIDLNSTNFIVSGFGGKIRDVYLSSLKWCGISLENIVFANDELFFIERMLYVRPITMQPWVKAPLAVDFLEELGERIVQSGNLNGGNEKIFLLRPEAVRRPLLNIADVKEIFLENGYVGLQPYGLTFEQQVQAFSKAKYIAGVLGAEFTNSVFSPPGVSLLGLAPEQMQDDFYWDLMAHKQGKYFCLHGESVGPSKDMNSPFTIDVVALRGIIKEFEKE